MSQTTPPSSNGSTATHSGRCACGGVQYTVSGELRSVSNCHCEPCRRITGHHMAATSVDSSAIDFEAKDSLQWWSRTPTVDYGFCNNCGSTLFWRAADKPDHLSIAAGTLNNPTGLRTYEALFVADAADYHELDPSVLQHTHDR